MGGVGVGKAAALFLALIATGCASGASNRVDRVPVRTMVQSPVGVVRSSADVRDAFATLLVENRSGYQVAVRLNGWRMGTVMPGSSCLRLPGTVGELRLEFVALGQPGHRAPLVFFEESAHWSIELRPGVTIKYEVLSLLPRRSSCAG